MHIFILLIIYVSIVTGIVPHNGAIRKCFNFKFNCVLFYLFQFMFKNEHKRNIIKRIEFIISRSSDLYSLFGINGHKSVKDQQQIYWSIY